MEIDKERKNLVLRANRTNEMSLWGAMGMFEESNSEDVNIKMVDIPNLLGTSLMHFLLNDTVQGLGLLNMDTFTLKNSNTMQKNILQQINSLNKELTQDLETKHQLQVSKLYDVEESL